MPSGVGRDQDVAPHAVHQRADEFAKGQGAVARRRAQQQRRWLGQRIRERVESFGASDRCEGLLPGCVGVLTQRCEQLPIDDSSSCGGWISARWCRPVGLYQALRAQAPKLCSDLVVCDRSLKPSIRVGGRAHKADRASPAPRSGRRSSIRPCRLQPRSHEHPAQAPRTWV